MTGIAVVLAYLTTSIWLHLRLLPFQRASLPYRYTTTEAIGDIAAAHLVHLVVIGVAVATSRASLLATMAPTPAPSARRIFQWACRAHWPFALWAAAGCIMLWSASSEAVSSSTLDRVHDQVSVWSSARPFVWLLSAASFVWFAHKATGQRLAVAALQTLTPVLLMWGFLEFMARVVA
jgi:hypothetical protein